MDSMNFQRALVLFAFVIGVAWAGTAQAESISFKVPLSGAQSVPPVQTSGKGTADLTYDPTTRVVTWNIAYSDLSSPATMAHFHGPAKKGANAPVIVWLTTKGAPPTSPITGKATLTPEQAKQFMDGLWYINLHTKDHPPGEIRAQVVPPKG